ncbi:glycoside hydrolase family 1 protein [Jiangella ureilytica]|uniref:Glycoside hydrolase family 1 protein n=1 Tax=Jiangella ureilytica TaxID=2530374 RepID=A0A4R4RHJ8_9ACTN|nr:family 1 glycosylhydrolase [Jiangella ureilytica]TDC48032.1 glycoside hydrolase family 1 protein [Jiangella ureilytica]
MTRWYQDGELRFAVGFEDTFVPQAGPGARALDEYELTQHYHFWREDLTYARDVGASMIRWGIPWYRVNPERGRWDWSWLDQVVEHIHDLGLVTIVDLMHYGTPLWLDNQFVNAAYPELVAEYAARVAERYGDVLRDFTPLNEPMLNVLFCGQYGVWPPSLTGTDGFVKLLRAIVRGIVETQRAVAAVSPEATFVHVEAAFRFDSTLPGRAAEVEFLRHRALLVEDLVTGRVDAAHPLVGFLTANGFTDHDLAWSQANTAQPDVMGVNYYPLLSTELLDEVDHVGSFADPRPRRNDWTAGLADVLTTFAGRYDCPVFLTETCVTGTVEERLAWLDASVAEVRRLRSDGLDVVGYTWWPLTDMVEWTYREGTGRPMDHHLAMGLWDLVEDGAGVLRRVRNPVADRFHAHARAATAP